MGNTEDLATLAAVAAGTVVGLRRMSRVLDKNGLLPTDPVAANLHKLAGQLADAVDKVSPALIRTIEEFSP